MEENRKLTPRQARAITGLSSAEMAKRIGLSPSAYRNKECGKTEFSVFEAFDFCKEVGSDINDIIFLEPPCRKHGT